MMAGIRLDIRHTARMVAQALFAATLTTPAGHHHTHPVPGHPGSIAVYFYRRPSDALHTNIMYDFYRLLPTNGTFSYCAARHNPYFPYSTAHGPVAARQHPCHANLFKMSQFMVIIYDTARISASECSIWLELRVMDC